MDKVGFVETPVEIVDIMFRLSTAGKDSLILDTGFGRGAFIRNLVERGYRNCWGIEIDTELYTLVKREIGDRCNLILGDFLKHNFDVKFDLIIGNPPYVHYSRLPQDMKDVVKNMTKTPESDIYYAFIIKSIQLLKEGGELIYIVPYHFFYNTHGRVVREMMLLNGKIDTIIDLDEVRIFSGENPETVIFKFVKGSFRLENLKIKVSRIKQKGVSLGNMVQDFVSMEGRFFEHYLIPHYTSSNAWSSHNFEFSDFGSIPLKNIAKVGVGPVSGFDEAFLLSKDDILNDDELRLVKRFVKARNCKRYTVDGYTNYILIDNSVSDEEELSSYYPNIYSKLIKYKDRMLNRYLPSGKKWFHWQALRNYLFLLRVLDKDKIFVPVLDRHKYNRFSLGRGGLLPSGDVIFIYPYGQEDLYFLLGYLNTKFFRNYYLKVGGRRGGRILFTQRLFESVGIPILPNEVKSKISEIVVEIIRKREKHDDTSELENEIERIVGKGLMDTGNVDQKIMTLF
ncbi:MAG: class I SAM-dependent methyltransferase [Spirochaetia bacterium]|nr:class I SAM-dependent methyltransferase [Spirochaetota bacterium]MDW8113073.1 class I SAM-dependent methyltransferase [Spirochaetia bacterium]